MQLPSTDLQLVPARAIGSDTFTGAELASSIVNDGDRLTTTIAGSTYNLWFDTDGAANSAVDLNYATPGSNPTRARLGLSIADSNLAALHADDNLFIGSTYIPFASAGYSPSFAGFTQAIEAALGPGYDVSYITGATSNGRQEFDLYYPSGVTAADTSVSGTAVFYEDSAPAYPASSPQTDITISEHDIIGLYRSTEPFQIGGVSIDFSPAYEATKEGLLEAITDAFAESAPTGTIVSPALPVPPSSLPAGSLNVTITYPAGYRAPDTIVGGIGTNIEATGDIDTMLFSMQSELRALTGDDTLFVKLKNGEITVSAGSSDDSRLAFASLRDPDGTITGDILGLAPGPYEAIPGSSMHSENTYADLMLNDTDKLVISMGGITRTYSFDTDGRQNPGEGEIEIDATGSIADVLTAIEANLRAEGGWAASNAVVTYGSDGVHVEFPGNYYFDVSISGSAADKFEIAGTHPAQTGGLTAILATDADRFLTESVSGGATTVYAPNGAAADVQFRWAKVDSASVEGQDTWHLYYLADSNAVGNEPMWVNVGQSYVFENGILVPPGVDETTIHNLTINSIAIGDVNLRHNQSGISQFANESGTVSVSGLAQDGYGSGEFQSVAITDNGRVIAAYSNGEQIEVAQLVTAQFNSPNALKHLDGGVYQTTVQSGEPIFDQAGSGIVGGALEASNTDISEEFTKLIITQQAYSAGTRMVSAADEMLQEALNMMR